MIGKRVDYSGRSVIVVGPTLRLAKCGLPKKMIWNCSSIHLLQAVYSCAARLDHQGGERLVEREGKEVWDILEEVIREIGASESRATCNRLGSRR